MPVLGLSYLLAPCPAGLGSLGPGCAGGLEWGLYCSPSPSGPAQSLQQEAVKK